MFNENEEKRNRFIFIVFLIVFFSIAFLTTRGQIVDRIRNNNLNKDFVLKYPDYSITFESPKSHNDTIFLSVLADSVSFNNYDIRLYAYYPSNIKEASKSDITIYFSDGSFEKFKQVYFDNGYAEYSVKKDSGLMNKKCRTVFFGEIAKGDLIKTENYFKYFLVKCRS